jgi:hypothetical protein
MIEIRIEIDKDKLNFIKHDDLKQELRLLLKDYGKDVRDFAVEDAPKDTGNLSQSIIQRDIEEGTEIVVGNDDIYYAKFNEPPEPEGYGVVMTRPMTRKAFLKVNVIKLLPVLGKRIERMLQDKLINYK